MPADHDANTTFNKVAIGFLSPTTAQFHLTDCVVNMVFRFLKAFFIILGHVSAPCAAIGANILYGTKVLYRNPKGARVS